MAVYFDQKLETDFNSIKTHCLWHSELPLLAVVSYAEQSLSSVNIYTESGEELSACIQQRSSIATSLCWHPLKKIVVTGWESGDITIYNADKNETQEPIAAHSVPVTHVCYTAKGLYLASADKSGVVCIWKSDTKGTLQGQPLHEINLNEPITELLYKSPRQTAPNIDLAKLAKAAVSGDESALDMFTWQKGGVNLTSSLTHTDTIAFFVGGASGGIYYLNEKGGCLPVTTLDSGVKTLLYNQSKNILVSVTDNLYLLQHSILGNNEAEEISKVKLSGKGEDSQVIWAGHGLLAVSTSDVVIRMLDLDKGENYFLTLESHSGYTDSEAILCLSYSERKGILAGGTNMGNIAMWVHSPAGSSHNESTEPESRWKLQAPSTVEGPVNQLNWGPTKSLLSVNTTYNIIILNEQVMNCSYAAQIAVLQVGPSLLTIDVFSTGAHHEVRTDIQVKGVATTQDALVVWNGKKAVVYEYAADKSIVSAGSFATEATHVRLYDQNLYTLEDNKVQVRTFQGTVKQTINFSESEGQPVCLDICSTYLVIGTSTGLIKVYDLSRREAKLHSNPKQISDHIKSFSSLVSAKSNCSGNRVSVLVNINENQPDVKLYIIDLETDSVQYFNFDTGHGEQDDLMLPIKDTDSLSDDNLTDDERGKTQAARDIAGRYPISHFWDPEEPKLLVCEACITPSDKPLSVPEKVTSFGRIIPEEIAEKIVVTLFSTSENGVIAQGSYPTPVTYNCLLGVHVPYHYFVRKSEDTSSQVDPTDKTGISPKTSVPRMVSRQIMRDFVGLDKSDKQTRDAMINFSFHLAIGNMDEAFKAIKLIKSETVWENLAKMCVKSRRLDVAAVCLGKMGHARGAMMLREATKEPELDARVASLAIQLELYVRN